jgi:hypothetical protein
LFLVFSTFEDVYLKFLFNILILGFQGFDALWWIWRGRNEIVKADHENTWVFLIPKIVPNLREQNIFFLIQTFCFSFSSVVFEGFRCSACRYMVVIPHCADYAVLEYCEVPRPWPTSSSWAVQTQKWFHNEVWKPNVAIILNKICIFNSPPFDETYQECDEICRDVLLFLESSLSVVISLCLSRMPWTGWQSNEKIKV